MSSLEASNDYNEQTKIEGEMEFKVPKKLGLTSKTYSKVPKKLGLTSKTYSKEEFIKRIKDKMLEKKINNINKYVEYISSSKGKEEIIKFVKKVVTSYWIQYQCETSQDEKTKKLQQYSINLLPNKIKLYIHNEICLNKLMKDFKSKIETLGDIEIKCYLDDFLSINSKIDNYIKSKASTSSEYINTLEKFSSNWVSNAFKDIDSTLGKKLDLHFTVLGKLGVGKSTLVSVIEGYLSTINNTPINERNISSNGRGTTEISTTNVKVGSIDMFIYDTIGQGDPGKGYTQEEIWLKNRKHYETISDTKGISTIDTILNTIDASIPRLDQADFDTLKHLFIEFKRLYPDDLSWWKKIIIVLTKVNCIRLKKYDSSGGLPKYESKKWLKEMGIKVRPMEGIELYNEVYKDMVIPAMKEWKEAVEERIYEKIYNPLPYENGGQSFISYFKYFAKEYYPDVDEETISNYIKNMKVIPIGEASQDPDVDNLYDYRNCEIKPIPNFRDALPDMFDSDLIESDINDFTYCKNWFSKLMNSIYTTTDSDKFRLTVYKLNEVNKNKETTENKGTQETQEQHNELPKSSDLEKDNNQEVVKNNIVNFDEKAAEKVNEAFDNTVETSVLGNIGKGIVYITKLIIEPAKSVWKLFFG